MQIYKCLKIQQGFCIVTLVFDYLLFNFCPSKPFDTDKEKKYCQELLFSQKEIYFKLNVGIYLAVSRWLCVKSELLFLMDAQN